MLPFLKPSLKDRANLNRLKELVRLYDPDIRDISHLSVTYHKLDIHGDFLFADTLHIDFPQADPQLPAGFDRAGRYMDYLIVSNEKPCWKPIKKIWLSHAEKCLENEEPGTTLFPIRIQIH